MGERERDGERERGNCGIDRLEGSSEGVGTGRAGKRERK